MSYIKSLFVSVVLVGALAACANQQTIPEPMVQGVQRIGIASAIGDSLEYRQIAMVAVGNETEQISTQGLSFDRFVKKQVAKNLKGRYALESVKVPGGQKDPTAIVAAAEAARKADPLDAYLIVVPAVRAPRIVAEGNAAVHNTAGMYGALGSIIGSALAVDHHDYSGLGLYRAPSGAYAYAVADLVLVDARTRQELRRVPLLERHPRTQPEVINGEEMLGDMRAISGGDDWPDQFDQFSKAQKKEVSASFSVLLRVAVAQSLRQAGLTY